MCRLVLPGARSCSDFQKETVCIVCPLPTVGETYSLVLESGAGTVGPTQKDCCSPLASLPCPGGVAGMGAEGVTAASQCWR